LAVRRKLSLLSYRSVTFSASVTRPRWWSGDCRKFCGSSGNCHRPGTCPVQRRRRSRHAGQDRLPHVYDRRAQIPLTGFSRRPASDCPGAAWRTPVLGRLGGFRQALPSWRPHHTGFACAVRGIRPCASDAGKPWQDYPAIVRTYVRAFALSVIPGNRRRSSIAADSSPSSLKMARMASASASVTRNIPKAWWLGAWLASTVSIACLYKIHLWKLNIARHAPSSPVLSGAYLGDRWAFSWSCSLDFRKWVLVWNVISRVPIPLIKEPLHSFEVWCRPMAL
jgi:hypothetical protein